MVVWRLHTATLFYGLLSQLPDIDLFLDVGSLDGRESFGVERRFPKIKCVAIEPNPHNINVIRSEIARRNSHIDLETFAAGNENGTTSFYKRIPVGSQNYGASSLLKFSRESRNEEYSTEVIEVPLRRLDGLDFVSTYKKLAMWIDVEGAGYQVLEGLAGIAQKIQLVHIETETKSWFEGEKLAPEVMKIMGSYGFELIGSNLDKNFRRSMGDMVFLRRNSLSPTAVRRALTSALIVERFAVQRMARKLLPAKLYRSGRDWLVQNVAFRS